MRKNIFKKYYFFLNYFTIRGGSRKKMAKKIIPSVLISREVYTRASIFFI